jgi:hypothetical protein
MNKSVCTTGFVSTAFLMLYSAAAKILQAPKAPSDMRSIQIALVLARAIEVISNLVLDKGRGGIQSECDGRAVGFAASVREELVAAATDPHLTSATAPPPVSDAILIDRAITTIDLLLGDRAFCVTEVGQLDTVQDCLNLIAGAFAMDEDALRWLYAPSDAFDGDRPIDLLQTRESAQMVKKHLAAQSAWPC